jgi:type IV secretory pathway TraG/TraD family ATPase VirD4
MHFEVFFARLLTTILAVFFLSLATVDASVFPECNMNAEAQRFYRADAEPWAKRVCDVRRSTFKTWEVSLQKLNIGQDDLSVAANAENWKNYREKFSELLPVMKDIETAAMASRNTTGSTSNILSLYRSDLGLFLQSASLGTAANLDDFSARISDGLNGPRPAAAATAGISVVRQSVTRGIEFVKGLAEEESNKILAEYRSQLEQKVATRREQLSGNTVSGYFGGFTRRITEVWGAFFFVLFVLMLGSGIVAAKRKQNPVTMAAAAALAYLLPGLAMMLALILVPFLTSWVIVSATLVGTYVMYARGGHICGMLASKLSKGSTLGRWLRIFGGSLDNLRAGLQKELGTQQVTHGSARWGTASEIRQTGHLVAPGKIGGFALGRVVDAPAGFDQRFRFTGHVVTVAPTGSGKGIGSVIPNLLDYPGSALVLDVKGENAIVTARARRALGQAVHVIDPFAVNGDDGSSFNVLDRLDVRDPDCVSESAILADALVISESKGDGVHFDESAKNFLQGLMLHVATLNEVERRNLGELRRLLTAGEADFFDMLGMMASDETIAFGIPTKAATTLMGMADKERSSVISTARRNTAFLDDPRIATALSRSGFDLSEIKTTAMTIYLVMPANRIGPNARFLRLFISSVIAAVTSSNLQPTHRVAFLLDEFGQLGYMKQIEDAVSLLRGYGMAFWVFIQDLSQLKRVYPKWQTFLANSAKSFYGTDDYDTAKYISDSLGKSTIEFETENTGRNSGIGISSNGGSLNRGKSSGTSQQFTGRELLTPDEVMRLGPERPIVLVNGEYPYLLDRLNYLTDREYAGQFDANPYHS